MKLDKKAKLTHVAAPWRELYYGYRRMMPKKKQKLHNTDEHITGANGRDVEASGEHITSYSDRTDWDGTRRNTASTAVWMWNCNGD